MKHIAFLNIPALGHLYPTLPLAAELVRRGHRVTYPAVAQRADLVRATGAAVVGYESTRPSDSDPAFQVPRNISGSLLNFLIEAEQTLPQWEEALLPDRPDLVLFDRMAFAGGVLARKHGIPCVQLWPMLVSGPQWSWADPIDPEDPTWLAYQARLEKFLADQGLPVPAEDFLTPPVRRHIAFLPRAFQPHASAFGAEFEFVGPCLAPRETAWQPPTGADDILLITLGTLNNLHLDFYRLCFEAFAGSRWRVVLPVGSRFPLDVLGRVPGNFEVLPSVAQLDVLSHAKAFVSHAGLNGVLEAVCAGVPQVAVARTPEQRANAARITELGLGVSLDPATMTASALRESVDRAATDASISAAVGRLRREAIDSGGTLRAADVVQECLSG